MGYYAIILCSPTLKTKKSFAPVITEAKDILSRFHSA
jgi:hypothetical protein